MLPTQLPAVRTQVRGLALLFAATLTGAMWSDAVAQSRWVFVNGQRLHDAQVAALVRTNCGDIPDGAYWLNTRTGAWGYAGNPTVQGVFGERCARNAGPTRGSNLDGTRGPFVTMRRAEEEAAGYRAQGYRAVAFHNGDGYYIRVSR
jgi:hypothetical protein